MQFLDFLKQKIIVFQSRSVPLSTCIFFAEKAKKDTAAIGAKLEVLVSKRSFSWSVYAILSFLFLNDTLSDEKHFCKKLNKKTSVS
jgi:hypothetical protein